MKNSHYYLALLVILSYILYGCLKFGDDVELAVEEVDTDVLSKVTMLTSVVFPDGSEGRNYLYFGSGIDDALAIKVSIPRDKKDEFLKNIVFTSGEKKEPYIHIGREKIWWNPDSLTNPDYTIYNFENGDMLECTIGEENGETIAYISWITI